MTRFADTGSIAARRNRPHDPRQDGHRAFPARNLLLDLEHLRVYTSGDEALEREVLGLFLDELPRSLAALTAAKSPREWHMAAHTLKGSALGVGATTLANLSRQAEKLESPLHPDRASIIAAITAAIADVASEIQRLGLT